MVSLRGAAPGAAVRAVAAALAAAGCPDAAYDARELYRIAAGHDSRLDRGPLPDALADRLQTLAARRAAREPLQYLAGCWDFLDFTLAVGPGVLCPRPDSETVCEAALDCLRQSGQTAPRVFDLCAGSGCLGLGIRRFCPGAAVTCVEKSPEALFYLRRNAARALPGFDAAHPAVTVAEADVFALWQTLPGGGLDLIVSNPPYLTAAEMAHRMPEVAREPAMALDGGDDGLAFYRLLTARYRAAVRPGGWLVLEIGATQAEAVTALGRQAGWRPVFCRRDLGGRDRAVALQNPALSGEG